MASASTTEVFNCTPDQFFDLITEYEKYPEFLQEVKQVTVLKTEQNRRLVEFHVSVIKSFSYSLWLTEERPREIRWEFASGDVFKTNSGYWRLQEQAGKTSVDYSVEATFKLFVPGPIAKTLVSVNLPNMMAAYHKRVASLYGQV